MRTIDAGNVRLVPQAADHATEMFRVLSDPAIYEFENEPPCSEEWLRDRFAKLESRASKDGMEQWLNWVVALPTGELAGYVQSTVVAGGRAHIAYVLASAHWGRGIGSTAVTAMMRELSAGYAVREVFATLKARNHRSLALLERLGFTRAAAADGLNVESDEIVMRKSVSG